MASLAENPIVTSAVNGVNKTLLDVFILSDPLTKNIRRDSTLSDVELEMQARLFAEQCFDVFTKLKGQGFVYMQAVEEAMSEILRIYSDALDGKLVAKEEPDLSVPSSLP